VRNVKVAALPSVPSVVHPVVHPVFEGLACLKYPVKKVSEIMGVDLSMVEQWSRGEDKISDVDLVFLTLLLAYRIDEIEASYADHLKQSVDLQSDMHAPLKEAVVYLEIQEAVNYSFAVPDIRQGVQNFRSWWRDNASFAKK